jgi:Ca2+-binding EF-hand superfamily protein
VINDPEAPMSFLSQSILSVTLLITVLLSSCRTVEEETQYTAGINPAAFKSADSNSDEKLSQTEMAEHLHREALNEFDLNEDGFISSEEWAITKTPSPESNEHFNQVDKNGDDRIDQDEAITYITDHVKFGDAFSEIDRNGDFHLHWEELTENDPTTVNFVLFSAPL